MERGRPPEVTVSVHQPNFLPWLKLLDKILASDVYVAYDTVQYVKSEYHARQRVKSHTGPVWLTMPVRGVPGARQLLREARIDNGQPFRHRHLRLLRTCYTKAEFFDEVYPIVEEVYGRGHDVLVDLNLDLIEALCRYLDSPVRIVRASSLPHDGDNTDRLVQLVRRAGGNVHLTSTYGTERTYIDWDRAREAGVGVRSQVFDHPVYDQLWRGFVPNLAALDMLFTHGRTTGKVLSAGRRFDDVDAAGAAVAEAAAEQGRTARR